MNKEMTEKTKNAINLCKVKLENLKSRLDKSNEANIVYNRILIEKAELEQNQQELNAGIAQIQEGQQAVETQLAQLQEQIPQLEAGIGQLQAAV